MSPNSASPRGATLVELLVASAVGIIVLVATLAVFDASRTAQATSERLITTYQSLSLGVLGLQRQMENVGYKFPGQSIFVSNNVAAGTQFSSGHGNAAVLEVSADGPGIVPETDVFEFLVGDETRGVGTVLSTTGTTDRTVVLDAMTPITPAEDAQHGAGLQGPLLVFSDGTTSCLGLVIQNMADSPPTYVVRPQLISGNDPAPPTGCPANGMRVFGLRERRRYMVYHGANGADLGLYVQVSQPLVTGFQNAGTLSAPSLLVRGVEDMQVSPTLANAGNALGCNLVTCQCNDGTGLCDGTTDANRPLVRALRIRLTSQGLDPIRKMGMRRPAVFDRAAGNVDNLQRSVMEVSIEFPNLNPVLVDPT